MRARLLGLASAVLVAGCSVFGGKAAEEPDYRVVVSDGDFEVRDYPALAVAATESEGDWDAAIEAGFRRLFDYISGANQADRDIAMTAPVLTEAKGQKIDMTAPVLTEQGRGGWRTFFVLPEGMTAENAPRPTDGRVTIETLPARRVAVVTFSGTMSDARYAEQRARLEAWLAGRPETPADDWQMAGYNPPWTLPWLRRNEVLVTLRPE